ncbi:hypothetical protein [Bosea sp. (in: a-proteobacteria)]|uniref:hypothetical protein n=1 Tax=Bosea sp. (in: a-proteobacteria) TaxID=1871050 RepID=UPI002733B713|nr:hypothetical protein [Bosea sp. (in: a-proteobacteria)]MDP3408221.1 hypothetical protein [Bosea sp. (in: a-proteobacteria)]
MASTLMVDIETAVIAVELAGAGSDFADLINEVASVQEANGYLLSDHEMTFFRQYLDEGGRALLCQLATALDAEAA